MEFFSVKEFAVYIRVHTNTIYRAIKSGRLNAFRINKGKRSVIRIAASEVQRLSEKDMQEIMDAIQNQYMKKKPSKDVKKGLQTK